MPLVAPVSNGKNLKIASIISGKLFPVNERKSKLPLFEFCKAKKWVFRRELCCSENVSDALCVAEWLYKCSVQKLVVVISNIESGEVLERWQFDIECDKTAKEDG